MVSLRRRFIFGALILLSLSPVSAKDLGAYQVGDKAEEDIVAPFRLVVINTQGTQALRGQEARRIPALFRFNPDAVNEVETSFRSALENARTQFLNAVENTFQRRTLQARALASPRFDRICARFKARHPLAGLSNNLCEIWARGESDESLRAAVAARLRAAMGRYIRRLDLPADIELGRQVRLLTTTNASEAISVELAETRGRLVQRADVYLLVRVKDEFASTFPPSDKAVATRLASFLKDNCVLDADLTRLVRAKHIGVVWNGDSYEPGQILVKRGQVIDARAKAALSQLHDKLLSDRSREQLDQLQGTSQRNRSLLAGGLAIVLMLVLVALRLGMRRRATPHLPARIGTSNTAGTVIANPSSTETLLIPSSIAGTAGAQTPPAGLVFRAALAPHLARLLMNKFVHKLISQRSALLDTQQQAAMEVAQLEARLELIQAPLQERLRAYERRIVELEQELAARGEENRALTTAKISAVKKQQEAERARIVVERN
jgi:membrane-associated HD superfamily phosphohydrolase